MTECPTATTNHHAGLLFHPRASSDDGDVARGTVYNRLRSLGVKVVSFAAPGKRGKKLIPTASILEIETLRTRRIC